MRSARHSRVRGQGERAKSRPYNYRGAPRLHDKVRYIFHNRLVLQPFGATLAAIATFFNAAKGSFGNRSDKIVD